MLTPTLRLPTLLRYFTDVTSYDEIAAACGYLIAEAGKPAPGSSDPSLNNLRRAGLLPLYDRQNWRWSGSA